MNVTDIPVLAEVIRSGFTESRHHGSAVVLGADGRWRYFRDPALDPWPRDDGQHLTADAAAGFAEGLVTFVQGVVDGLRRPD